MLIDTDVTENEYCLMEIKKAVRRNITLDDLAASKTLKRLWDEYCRKDGALSQEEFAEKHCNGMKQSQFSNLMHGRLTWSTDHVLMMANAFNVSHTLFKTIPYLDYIPKPKPLVVRDVIDTTTDEFLKQVVYCFTNGLSNEHKDAIAMMTNKLYSIDKPKDRIATPYINSANKVAKKTTQ